eukprot:scaffold351051_cov30-Prasinocladus_malaysianus.AAC.1
MDLSSADSISFLELCTALIKWEDMDPRVFRSELQRVYRRLDTEGKGYLTSQDLQVLLPPNLQGESPDVKEVAAQRMMRDLDHQVDGILSQAAFMRIVRSETGAEALIHYDDRLNYGTSDVADDRSHLQPHDRWADDNDYCCELDVEGFFP